MADGAVGCGSWRRGQLALARVGAGPLRPPPEFRVGIGIQLGAARVSGLSFPFLWLWCYLVCAYLTNLVL